MKDSDHAKQDYYRACLLLARSQKHSLASYHIIKNVCLNDFHEDCQGKVRTSGSLIQRQKFDVPEAYGGSAPAGGKKEDKKAKDAPAEEEAPDPTDLNEEQT